MLSQDSLKKIRAILFDCDGVMTDGSAWILYNGDAIRSFNVKDGYAIQYAVKKGYILALITGANSQSTVNRMQYLGVKHIFSGCANKMQTYRQFLDEQQLTSEQVLYMGDDIPDYEIMRQVGIAACPADAVPEILEVAHYISPIKGGHGCLRDVIEQVLRAQGQWFHSDAVNW
ncbi:MAG: HAD-IIIA family hydrolase [Bacteroidales bacterium]|nr:HAD-IIIA family hydrolase [Bacteroidales bacterium]